MPNEVNDAVMGCARVLADHDGGDVLVLDLRKLSAWTDWFVVATATSSTHMRGLLRHVEEYLHGLGVDPLKRPHPAEDEQWCLVDYGDFVVHIMAAPARAFYELEKLWFEAEPVPVAPTGPRT